MIHRVALLFTLLLQVSPLLAAGPRVTPPKSVNPPIGHSFAPEAFRPMPMTYVGDLDRLNRDFNLQDDEPIQVRREQFGGTAEPEWLVMSPERLCGIGGCLYVLFDGLSAREIGRFFGTLIVLHRQQNGYPVIQTISRQEDGFASVRTFSFADRQYQVDDEVLIGEAARLRMESTVEFRR